MKCLDAWILLLILFVGVQSVSGQNVLPLEEAVSRALENNLNITVAENNVDIAKNRLSKNNTGKLPTVGLNAGYNFNLDNITANFQDGRSTSLKFADSHNGNISANAGYVIFDGFFRKYNIQQLEEQHALSHLAMEAVMENIAAQTILQYYQIASLTENVDLLNESISISERRIEQAEQRLEFGQGSGLNVLNAKVDLNNDSLSLLNLNIEINNAKRLLNNLMVDQETIDYDVNVDTDFIAGLSRETLKEEMLRENIALSQIDKNIEIGKLSVDLAKSRKLPVINANASYGFNYNKNNSASFLSSATNNGLGLGATASWNIFDGQTKHAIEEARLQNISLELEKEQLVENMKLDFETAWANYQDRIFIFDNQEKNVDITRANFERTEEQFKIGQITSVDFRQAQLNLLNAEVSMNNAAFQVKLAEVELLLLSGRILE